MSLHFSQNDNDKARILTRIFKWNEYKKNTHIEREEITIRCQPLVSMILHLNDKFCHWIEWNLSSAEIGLNVSIMGFSSAATKAAPSKKNNKHPIFLKWFFFQIEPGRKGAIGWKVSIQNCEKKEKSVVFPHVNPISSIAANSTPIQRNSRKILIFAYTRLDSIRLTCQSFGMFECFSPEIRWKKNPNMDGNTNKMTWKIVGFWRACDVICGKNSVFDDFCGGLVSDWQRLREVWVWMTKKKENKKMA